MTTNCVSDSGVQFKIKNYYSIHFQIPNNNLNVICIVSKIGDGEIAIRMVVSFECNHYFSLGERVPFSSCFLQSSYFLLLRILPKASDQRRDKKSKD